MEGHWTEARGWLDVFRTLHRAGDSPPAPVRLATYPVVFAGFARLQGDMPRALALLREEEALLRRQGQMDTLAVVLTCLGIIQEAPEAATPFYEEALGLCHALQDHEGAALLLSMLGRHALQRGDAERAAVLSAEAFTAVHTLGDARLTLSLLATQCYALVVHGDLHGAATVAEALLTHSQASAVPWSLGMALLHKAAVATEQGAYARAVALLEESRPYLGLGWWSPVASRAALASGTLAVARAHAHELLESSTMRHEVTGQTDALETLALIAWQEGDVATAEALCMQALDRARSLRGCFSRTSWIIPNGLFGCQKATMERAKQPYFPSHRFSRRPKGAREHSHVWPLTLGAGHRELSTMSGRSTHL
jgi:hypothetical protein